MPSALHRLKGNRVKSKFLRAPVSDKKTPTHLSCFDRGPHPSEQERIYYFERGRPCSETIRDKRKHFGKRRGETLPGRGWPKTFFPRTEHRLLSCSASLQTCRTKCRFFPPLASDMSLAVAPL